MHYYGIPAVSLRDVWFHKWARNEPGFRQRDVMCNLMHPNLLGHQCELPQQIPARCSDVCGAWRRADSSARAHCGLSNFCSRAHLR